jgi:hypothetical protein
MAPADTESYGANLMLTSVCKLFSTRLCEEQEMISQGMVPQSSRIRTGKPGPLDHLKDDRCVRMAIDKRLETIRDL